MPRRSSARGRRRRRTGMKPRNVVVTFECRNDIPAKDIVAGLEARLHGIGLIERPKVNVIRNRAASPSPKQPSSKASAANRGRK